MRQAPPCSRDDPYYTGAFIQDSAKEQECGPTLLLDGFKFAIQGGVGPAMAFLWPPALRDSPLGRLGGTSGE